MKEEPQNKCKDQGFVHAWKDITSNVFFAVYPTQYPPKQEQCQNCGLKRTHHQKVEKWFEYKVEPIDTRGSTVIVNTNGTTATNSGTSNMLTTKL